MKNKFITLYEFQIMDEIKAGHGVFMLDKLEGDTACVNHMRADHLVELLTEAEKDRERFLFWRVDVEEEEYESLAD